MARVRGFWSEEFMEALRAIGIVPEETRRVVIDISSNDAAVIYVEKFAGASVLKIVTALGGTTVDVLDAAQLCPQCKRGELITGKIDVTPPWTTEPEFIDGVTHCSKHCGYVAPR